MSVSRPTVLLKILFLLNVCECVCVFDRFDK